MKAFLKKKLVKKFNKSVVFCAGDMLAWSSCGEAPLFNLALFRCRLGAAELEQCSKSFVFGKNYANFD
jgi:hypothetical protein